MLPVVRQLLRQPESVEIMGGNLARQAEAALIGTSAGDNLSFREAITRKLELLRAELAGPAPAPLESLLVERVAACWLQLHLADIRLSQHEHNLTLAQAEYYDRAIDRAHKHYLSAIKTLALVRKLALPVLVKVLPAPVTAAATGGHGNRIAGALNGQHESNGRLAAP